MKCLVYQLGQIEYSECLQLQRDLQQQRIDGTIPDVLLLLEHPPTLTLGKTGRMENILVPASRLQQEGICLVSSDRGGDATYHGPGQLVAYPILSLKNRGQDVRQYVRNLEETAIRTLKDFGISAGRDKAHPGVWIDREEIAAIGVSVKNWVTMHGLALNVAPDMVHYAFINPCGFTDRKAASMADILGREIPMETVVSTFIEHFSDVFETPVTFGSIPPGPYVRDRAKNNLMI
ncbi:MAG: lipoyl(octanoyl) transferase LipB [Desulfobacterales bacterium]|nr:lipoyl(octanoyl) transferase LipB [Desulfobacterales bacterium]